MSDQQKVDLNDMSLETEELQINPEADAFSFPPPPPEGTYLARLKPGERGWSKGATKTGQQYLMGHIELRLQAPGERYDDNPVFDNASTLVMQSSGTSRVAGILKALGETLPQKATHAELARLLQAHLDREDEVRVKLQWEAYCQDDDLRIKGERRFPPLGENGSGGHKGQIACPKCGNELNAQARPVAYLGKEA